jgi:hypothetical protein
VDVNLSADLTLPLYAFDRSIATASYQWMDGWNIAQDRPDAWLGTERRALHVWKGERISSINSSTATLLLVLFVMVIAARTFLSAASLASALVQFGEGVVLIQSKSCTE